jgi:hypothetical protein
MSVLHDKNPIDVETASRTAPCGHVHPRTIHNWIRRGVRGIRLDAVRVGSRWWTSVEALHRFVEALTRSGEKAG